MFDRPYLTVTREVVDQQGTKHFKTREFAHLSLGQQQSVLLALMLWSENPDPLLIDQPEDNLDGEFIFSQLVPVIRLAKEHRQIIIVTHNPNIAVLGDAELIVVLGANNEQSESSSSAGRSITSRPAIGLAIFSKARKRPSRAVGGSMACPERARNERHSPLRQT